MSLKTFVKRIAPFLATFAVGLFVASFFVSIAAPSFHFGSRERRQQEMNRLQFENDQYHVNSCRMKRHLADLERQNADSDADVNDFNLDVAPPPPMPPAPMKAPAAPKVR